MATANTVAVANAMAEMATAAAVLVANVDAADTALVLENIRGVQRAVMEAENRMAVLALLGSRIDIADSFSYVCWLLASPEHLLCECTKLGDFAYCEQIVQMFKMSTRHRNIQVASRRRRRGMCGWSTAHIQVQVGTILTERSYEIITLKIRCDCLQVSAQRSPGEQTSGQTHVMRNRPVPRQA